MLQDLGFIDRPHHAEVLQDLGCVDGLCRAVPRSLFCRHACIDAPRPWLCQQATQMFSKAVALLRERTRQMFSKALALLTGHAYVLQGLVSVDRPCHAKVLQGLGSVDRPRRCFPRPGSVDGPHHAEMFHGLGSFDRPRIGAPRPGSVDRPHCPEVLQGIVQFQPLTCSTRAKAKILNETYRKMLVRL